MYQAQDMLNVDFNTGGQNPQVIRNATGSVVEISAGYQNAVNDVQRKSVDLFFTMETFTLRMSMDLLTSEVKRLSI